ncbi:MAG: hypothetical protein K2H72_01455, partial [Muribaculaceae bacterium]|nr:hypothetical protein [Muribaculaceae bacterium]
MKQLKLYLLLIACCSSCIEENTYINDCDEPKTVIGKQELNNELSQEAADEAYKSLLSIIEQKTRSGSNEIEKWYGGAYINDRGELVVKSTDLNLSSNLDIPNTVIEKCDYSLRNLENIRKKIEDLFYKDDHFVLNHIILFGINPMTNSFEVGLDDVSKENVSYFIDNISSCPAVRFVECKRPEFTSKELICAEMVSNLSNIVITETGKDSIFSASIGYRARKKDNGDIGVVTAGHFISKGQFLGRISNDAKDTIGICIDSRNMDGVLDAAFCKITNNNFYPSNKIDFMINPDVDTLSIELATPAVGRTINMVGC